jgi:hypothetical protein
VGGPAQPLADRALLIFTLPALPGIIRRVHLIVSDPAAAVLAVALPPGSQCADFISQAARAVLLAVARVEIARAGWRAVSSVGSTHGRPGKTAARCRSVQIDAQTLRWSVT